MLHGQGEEEEAPEASLQVPREVVLMLDFACPTNVGIQYMLHIYMYHVYIYSYCDIFIYLYK